MTGLAQKGTAQPLVLAFGLLFLTACDLSGTAERQSLDRFVDLSLLQKDAQGSTQVIDSFSVPPANRIPLQNAVKAQVTLKGYAGAKRYGRVGGDPNKKVVAFLLTFDGEIGGERLTGGPIVARETEGSVTGAPTGPDSRKDTFRGTYYGFFVEGIGDRPEAPIEVVLQGSEDTRKITIDPDQHMLPARYALHKSEKAFQSRGNLTGHPFFGSAQASSVGRKAGNPSLLADIDKVKLDRPQPEGIETPGPPYPLAVFHFPYQGEYGRAGALQVNSEFSSLGVSYEPPLENFDFYLLYLGR